MFLALGILAALMLLSSTLFLLLNQTIPYLNSMNQHQSAYNLAEAGIDKALAELRMNPAYDGEHNVPLGDGSFTVTVQKSGPYKYEIESIGFLQVEGRPKAQVRLAAHVVTNARGDLLEFSQREVKKNE